MLTISNSSVARAARGEMLALDPISQGWRRTQSGANPRRCDVRLCPLSTDIVSLARHVREVPRGDPSVLPVLR